ncbi:hypothetical protein HRG_000890 [Hirsutella rhossiliensis]|uniref:DUF7598 domain-containing protein n=1 Tax=Hirsutella rhossiliensis TaxID=111463 RepID=A0A9P8N5Y1_9HYPO|nr:uncharacterized protein HRG_00890 [Hirsutella rhossiliensis]KAH0968248.1 hypothetical protein HRG_00890 [Hirsutella rhossiliensis]
MLGIDMSSFRGTGMVVLQILRAFTVITLATLAASCWILVINVDKDRSYFVFECASYFFTSILCVVLILSEFPVLKPVKRYLRRTWPVLSDQHGLVWLGVALVVIGCNMLGNLNRPAYDPKNLGPHFSKLVLASSVLAITFGMLNVICSLVWRDGSEGINSRDIRTNGSLAESRRQSLPDYTSTAETNPSFANEKTLSKFTSLFSRNKKPKAEKAKPKISGPFPAQPDVEQQRGQDDDRRSPIVSGIKRPDTALHPMHAARESIYSEAHMSRF